jgi:hypothetical protein
MKDDQETKGHNKSEDSGNESHYGAGWILLPQKKPWFSEKLICRRRGRQVRASDRQQDRQDDDNLCQAQAFASRLPRLLVIREE